MQTKGSQGSRGIPKVLATEGNASQMQWGVMGCAHCAKFRSLTLTGNDTVPLPPPRTLAPRSPRQKATVLSNSVRRFLCVRLYAAFLDCTRPPGKLREGISSSRRHDLFAIEGD